MLTEILNDHNNIIISTGNILNVNKKAGQKPTEELLDCLRSTLNEPENITDNDILKIKRSNDDLNIKINENERKNVKIGVKIFLNNNSIDNLRDAIKNLFLILNVDYIDNLILAYHPKDIIKEKEKIIGVNGVEQEQVLDTIHHNTEVVKEGVIEWGKGYRNAFNDLKDLWQILEEYKNEKKINQLGIADLDTESLINLYNTCNIHPAIAQINLSACCVVPPPLQEFCNKHDIQLLTHSDPEEIITKNALIDLGVNKFNPIWALRYQVHVKCRGVLTAKGFIVNINKE